MSPLTRIFVAALALIVLGGCATKPDHAAWAAAEYERQTEFYRISRPYRPEGELRREREAMKRRLPAIQRKYGPLGLIVAPVRERPQFVQPHRRGPGAAERLGIGVKSIPEAGFGGLFMGGPAVAGVMMIFAPFFCMTTDDCVEGVQKLSDHDKERVESARQTLMAVSESLDVGVALADRLVETGSIYSEADLFAAVLKPPQSVENSIPYFVSHGIDPVLEVKIEGIAVLPMAENLRHSQLLMAATGRLFHSKDRNVIDEGFFCHRRGGPFFPSWADNDAKLFRDELDLAYASISAQIIAFLAGEHTEAEEGPCAVLQKQSEERGPRAER